MPASPKTAVAKALFALTLLSAVLPGAAWAGDIPLPPAVPDRIGRAQIFVHYIKDKHVLVGKRDIIWGDDDKEKAEGIYSLKYMMTDRDPDRKHDLEWYKANHPDWVSYKNDQTTPANEFRYWFGFNTPVDTTNPAVREYLLGANLKECLSTPRFDGVAVDNVECRNEYLRGGVWANGAWRQMYDGTKKVDPAFARDTATWMEWLAGRAHAAGKSLVANHYPHLDDVAGYRLVASKLDIICDEQGYTRKGLPMAAGQTWVDKMTLFADLASTKPLIIIDQLTKDPAKVTPEIINWALANYLLVKGDRTYVAWPTEDVYGKLDEYPELYLPIGRPLEVFTRDGDIYRRRFEKVLALVNPAKSAPASYHLDAGPWHDLQGKERTGTIELPPGSGLVLTH
jgi:hypothetical protein